MDKRDATFETVLLQLPVPAGTGSSASVELLFEPIPKGCFMMGERDGEAFLGAAIDPPVKVSFPAVVYDSARDQGLAFYLGRFPVTQAQFDCWRESEAYETWLQGSAGKELKGEKQSYDKDNKDRANASADSVSWYEAVAYCTWLNTQGDGFGIPEGFEARLPTEAEWEYSCRAGTDTEYHSGDGEAALATAGWYDENSEYETKMVGEKEKNEWGLHDLHGNVWEWCLDEQNDNAYRECLAGRVYQPMDLESTTDIAPRVLRGGSWFFGAAGCRSAIRNGIRPSIRSWDFGFRVGLFPVSGDSQPESGVGAGAFPDGAAERAQSGQDTAPTEPPLDLSEQNFKIRQ